MDGCGPFGRQVSVTDVPGGGGAAAAVIVP